MASNANGSSYPLPFPFDAVMKESDTKSTKLSLSDHSSGGSSSPSTASTATNPTMKALDTVDVGEVGIPGSLPPEIGGYKFQMDSDRMTFNHSLPSLNWTSQTQTEGESFHCDATSQGITSQGITRNDVQFGPHMVTQQIDLCPPSLSSMCTVPSFGSLPQFAGNQSMNHAVNPTMNHTANHTVHQTVHSVGSHPMNSMNGMNSINCTNSMSSMPSVSSPHPTATAHRIP